MTLNLRVPELTDLKPKITVLGVGGAGGNAVNNMIEAGLQGVEFVVANTDAQALRASKADRKVQMGVGVTGGLGAGADPKLGAKAAEDAVTEVLDHIGDSNMVFVTAGMGGGTGTGAAPVLAAAAREQGILTVGVVSKPFTFEGSRRSRIAEAGVAELQKHVNTLIVIPNQNLFRVATEKTTITEAFSRADDVLRQGVAGITDLMVKDGLVNLDFNDVRAVMSLPGKAMLGTGEEEGNDRGKIAAEKAILNPLLEDVSVNGARAVLVSVIGGSDMTLFEVEEAVTRASEEIDADANVIFGAAFDENLTGKVRVTIVATGLDSPEFVQENPQTAYSPASETFFNNQGNGSGGMEYTQARNDGDHVRMRVNGLSNRADEHSQMGGSQNQDQNQLNNLSKVLPKLPTPMIDWPQTDKIPNNDSAQSTSEQESSYNQNQNVSGSDVVHQNGSSGSASNQVRSDNVHPSNNSQARPQYQTQPVDKQNGGYNNYYTGGANTGHIAQQQNQPIRANQYKPSVRHVNQTQPAQHNSTLQEVLNLASVEEGKDYPNNPTMGSGVLMAIHKVKQAFKNPISRVSLTVSENKVAKGNPVATSNAGNSHGDKRITVNALGMPAAAATSNEGSTKADYNTPAFMRRAK